VAAYSGGMTCLRRCVAAKDVLLADRQAKVAGLLVKAFHEALVCS